MVPGSASCSHDHLGNAPFDAGHFGDDVLGWAIAFVFDILCITIVSSCQIFLGPWSNAHDP